MWVVLSCPPSQCLLFILKRMCHTLRVLVVSGQRTVSVDRMPLVWQDEEKDESCCFEQDKKLHFGL